MLRRDEWVSLNGTWQFAIDPDGLLEDPQAVQWNAGIQVPFAPETPASGVRDTSLFKACWYRRAVPAPNVPLDHRLLLHFGAVDYCATVWANGRLVGRHEGGYTPFTCDITGLALGGVLDVIVRAEDDPGDLAKPRGKQDWLKTPHSIWYERTSGIWQTVWMEVVPPQWIARIHWTPNLERWELACAVRIGGGPSEELRLAITLASGGQILADDQYLVIGGEVHRRIALSDPGIDDYRNTLLWNPARPTLIDAELRLLDAAGRVVDVVHSYTALRSVAAEGDRFVLNGRPYELRLVLDQGYWPDTGLTAPDDDAFRRDVELAKAMGFNGVRKHQKIEDPRYLYWADRLGLLVWEEMPSAYRFTQDSIERTTREWMAVLARDHSHPCIVAWVPFNESWGVPNLPQNAAERHYVRALYHLTKTRDGTRPVIGNDGWESIATDIIGIHDYDADPERLARRYHANDREPLFPRRERPGGRLLLLEGERNANEPIVLSEFGGITLARDTKRTWGYSRASSAGDLARHYAALLNAVRSIGLFAGFCYTQFSDTYQEANGLLYANREPKMPLAMIAAATTGAPRRRPRRQRGSH
ncbi:MAG TPA: glycoside hydrolase family 2 TIM barrel-domain containing protein [Vicinamibacterales bacterium]|nr:glycoside hydrolase family 2 TIM barrel-domain containing protein [Vicinamibacterales bacterium]